MSKVAPVAPTQVQPQKYYNPFTSIAIVVAAFLGAQVIGATLFSVLLLRLPSYRGLSGEQAQSRLIQDHWLYLLLIILVEAIAVLVMRWFMAKRAIRFSDLGFGQYKLKYAWYSAAGYAVVIIATVVLFALISAVLPGLNFDQKQELGVDITRAALLPMFFALVVIPPLVEEFIMRGFLFTNLRSRLSFGWAAVLVSALFGVAHINQTSDGLFWTGALNFFVLSLVLCYLREKTKSIWPSVGVHMLQNGIAFLALYHQLASTVAR